jgi:hypothetical protein
MLLNDTSRAHTHPDCTRVCVRPHLAHQLRAPLPVPRACKPQREQGRTRHTRHLDRQALSGSSLRPATSIVKLFQVQAYDPPPRSSSCFRVTHAFDPILARGRATDPGSARSECVPTRRDANTLGGYVSWAAAYQLLRLGVHTWPCTSYGRPHLGCPRLARTWWWRSRPRRR